MFFPVNELNKTIIQQSDQILCVIPPKIKIQYGRHTLFQIFRKKVYNILLSSGTVYIMKCLSNIECSLTKHIQSNY